MRTRTCARQRSRSRRGGEAKLRCVNAKHLLAAARGITRGSGCRCAVCGESPFGIAGPQSTVLGGNFTAFGALADRDAECACLGCESLLSGRPGDNPPPLRTCSVWTDGRAIRVLTQRELGEIVLAPPPGSWALSWAQSRQVHHWLYAGVSTAARMVIGSDAGPIEISEAQRPLVDAVSALLYSPTATQPLLSRTSIATGDYHPSAVQKFGHGEWQRHESIVSVYRPSALLDLLATCLPVMVDRATPQEPMIDLADSQAAQLLADVASASGLRSKDGKLFWGGVFLHRVKRFARLPLAAQVSRLMGALECAPTGSQSIVDALSKMDVEEMSGVERALRTRADLLVAMAYDILARRRAA